MPISRAAQWTLLAEPRKALEAVSAAVVKAKFKLDSLTTDDLLIDVPRAIFLDRWAAKIRGTITPDGDTTHISWTVEGLGDKHYAHLDKIAKGLPKGMLDDHGITPLITKTPGFIFAVGEITHLHNILDRGEMVLAMAVGKVADQNALGVATNRRVLFLEKGGIMTPHETLTAFDLSAIQTVHTTKAPTGESVTITYSGMTAIMTNTAHGSGDALANAIRTAKAAAAVPASPPPAQTPQTDVIGQLERLATLRSQGILTEEEFQSQKSSLLARN
jgi:hypothetical protein